MIFSLPLLTSSTLTNASTLSVGYTTNSISLTTSPDTLHIGVSPSVSGRLSSGILNALVATSGNVSGYNLSITTEATNGGVDGNLTSASGATIIPTTGTISTPNTFSSANCNSWGFAIGKMQSNKYQGASNSFANRYSVQTNLVTTDPNNTLTFAAVPTLSQVEQGLNNIIKNTTSNTPGFSDSTDIFFAACSGGNNPSNPGVNPDGTIESGPYTATVTLTATANAVPDYNEDHVIVDMDPNLIPVKYSPADGTDPTTYKADTNNAFLDWYSYSNRKWANAVTVKPATLSKYQNAEPNTVIDQSDILGYFVYIPRYQYQIQTLEYSNTNHPKAFNIQLQTTEDTKSNKSGVQQANDWITPPAFTFNGKELNGFWVAKYEAGTPSVVTGNVVDPNVLFKPGQVPRANQNISNKLKSSFGLITTHNLSTSTNNFPANTTHTNYGLMDSHMPNGDSWGSIATFSQSLYGVCTNANCTIDNTPANSNTYAKTQKVWNNAYYASANGAVGSTGINRTGCGRYNGSDSYSDGAACVSWYTSEGQLSSTTNSVEGITTGVDALNTPSGIENNSLYGIFDLAGGAVERGLSNYNCSVGSSGFSQAEIGTPGNPCDYSTGTYAKYINVYTNPPLIDSAFNISNGNYNFIPGDTLRQFGLTAASFETTAWNDDYANSLRLSNPWLSIGGGSNNNVDAGVFYTSSYNGGTAGSYRAILTHTDDSQPEQQPATSMQDFMPNHCSAMAVNDIITLPDARDNKEYKIKKMPDNKCWMYENLGYTGGGNNIYNDTVDTLIETTTGSTWDRTNTTRNYVNNSTAAVRVGDGTRCTTTETGSGTVQSICGNQILYNFCAANGLDANTTPTCAAVTNTTPAGTGMSSVGVVGAEGGKGGESKGSGGSSICPAGWRLPVGRVGTSDNSKNEWAILNGSMFNGTYTPTPDMNGDLAHAAYWQPKGANSAFGTVSAGSFYPPSNGLFSSSITAYWWSASLLSAGSGSFIAVQSDAITLGTTVRTKDRGFSVRCIYP